MLHGRAEEPCRICGEIMYVAIGQEAFYHKKCRKFRHNRSKALVSGTSPDVTEGPIRSLVEKAENQSPAKG